MANTSIVIKRSRISGRGIFAAKNFRKGSVVVRWHPKDLKKDDIAALPKRELRFVEKIGRKFYLMQPPERFMNHSCEPNTRIGTLCDVATRTIKKGEEITSDYSGHEIRPFKCRCGSPKCKKIVR